MMRTIHLHGEAGRLWGKKWVLDVNSLTEAVRAIGVQCKGFQQYVESRNWQAVRGKSLKSGFQLDDTMCGMLLGKSDLHIMPRLIGAGGKMGGLGKIIAGVLLAGFAWFAAPALGISSFAGMSMKTLGMLGVGLALQGVSSMLSAQKKSEKDDSSKLFQGVPDTVNQGRCVPIIVGRIRCSDMPVISTRIITSKV